MFDGILKSKFYTKCKSSIKLTKTRIEMIKRKRNAMQKYLRNDIADLLRSGLDIDGYGRAEGLLVELNMSACYDFVEQFCGCVSDHLSMMNKQRECPEECKEAVPSLMYAAARFADLPELRELRRIFSDRYGNSLEVYVNQEFVEKFKAVPPTKDMKLQLLQDIVQESGLDWDSKALEQKLYNPPKSEQAWSRNTNDDKHILHKSREEPVPKIDNQDTANKQHNLRDDGSKRNKEDLPSYGRKEVSDGRYKLHGSENNAVCGGDPVNDQQNISNSERNVSEEKADEKKLFGFRFLPPPYTKLKAGETETSSEAPSAGSSSEEVGTTKFNGHVDGEDNQQQEDSVGEAKPKPRSVRRRPLNPPLGHDIFANSNGMRPEAAKPGLKIVIEDGQDQKDEEERMMDKLLIHYSTKQSPYGDAGNATKNRTKDDPPARAASLPPEPTSPTETTKGHARASSFEPDIGRVHARLPDYDDLVARLAAFRGK